MGKFPVDAPKKKVIKVLQVLGFGFWVLGFGFWVLGFQIVREKEHIAMIRNNSDGTKTPLSMPNHPKIKGSTLRAICTQAGISRQEFLTAYYES